jgi:solute carrier family 25 (mitochondrial S-adenosylmethionine transporter), member 26
MSEVEAKRRQKRLLVGAHMLAGCAGEIAGCIIRVPAEVVKQRAQAGQSGGRSWNTFTNILKTHSAGGPTRVVRELYRGAGVTLLRELPFTMIQFPLWEALKAWHVGKYGPASSHLSSSTTSPGEAISAIPAALYGSLAGAVAAGITTPLDVLKTRLMLARESVGAVEMLRRIVQTSGPTALFAGLAPRTIWISLGGAIFLGSYQWAYNVLGEREQERAAY